MLRGDTIIFGARRSRLRGVIRYSNGFCACLIAVNVACPDRLVEDVFRVQRWDVSSTSNRHRWARQCGGILPLRWDSVQGVGMLQSTTSSSSSPAAPGSCLRGPCVLPAGLLRDCVVGLLSFMAAAVNMTGCLETICFQWLPHGNRELNLRRVRRLSQRQRPPSPRAILQGWWEGERVWGRGESSEA